MEKLQWHKEENIMNWKRVISGVLAAAMLSALCSFWLLQRVQRLLQRSIPGKI